MSTKLRYLINEIKVFTDGAKPNFEEVNDLVGDIVEDPEYRDRLLRTLWESHYEGPRSIPHFMVLFHNGTSRFVIPRQNDPTELVWQIDHGAEGVNLTGSSGLTDELFRSRLLPEDWPKN